jgi:hypothetical protein
LDSRYEGEEEEEEEEEERSELLRGLVVTGDRKD